MDPQQIVLIQDSWKKIVPIADTVARQFYDKLFELDPSLRPLFKHDLAEQGKKLTTMLNLVVNKLNDLDSIIGSVQSLGERHKDYGVRDKHYDTAAIALLWILKNNLGDGFTADVQRAWVVAYAKLATVMKSAATEQTSQVA